MGIGIGYDDFKRRMPQAASPICVDTTLNSRRSGTRKVSHRLQGPTPGVAVPGPATTLTTNRSRSTWTIWRGLNLSQCWQHETHRRSFSNETVERERAVEARRHVQRGATNRLQVFGSQLCYSYLKLSICRTVSLICRMPGERLEGSHMGRPRSPVTLDTSSERGMCRLMIST